MTEQSKTVTENVKTTFAPSGNPWGQLMKPESKVMKPTPAPKPTPKPKMQKQTKQPVKPAAPKAPQVVNPALPVQPKLTAACAVERIDLNAFEFDDMPFPGRTLGRENKYSKTLKDMPVNKRLKVPIGDAAVVKHGMSRVLKATRPGHILRAIDDCGDGMGGVWLLKDER